MAIKMTKKNILLIQTKSKKKSPPAISRKWIKILILTKRSQEIQMANKVLKIKRQILMRLVLNKIKKMRKKINCNLKEILMRLQSITVLMIRVTIRRPLNPRKIRKL